MRRNASHCICALAVALSLAASAGSSAPSPAQHRPTLKSIKVLSYNVAGAARQRQDHSEDKDPLRFVEVLAERIAAERPQLIGLQEVCGSQVNHLQKLLSERGYPMVTHTSIRPDKPDDGRCPVAEGPWLSLKVGKAVLTTGAAAPLPPGPGADVCVRWESGTPVRFCSVHTEPKEGKLATTARTLNEWAREGPVIAVGDFNARPEDGAMDSLYQQTPADRRGRGRFHEADWRRCAPGQTRCGWPTFPVLPFAYKKIDYVFADAASFPRDGMRAWVESRIPQPCGDAPCSDHHMLWAELALRVPDERASDFAAIAGTWARQQSLANVAAETFTFGRDGSMRYEMVFGVGSEPMRYAGRLQPLEKAAVDSGYYRSTFDRGDGVRVDAWFVLTESPSGPLLHVDGYVSGTFVRQ